MRIFRTQKHIHLAAAAAIIAGGIAYPAPAHADKVRDDQWHLKALNIAQAHALAPKLGDGVKIGIMDTGVDGNHPDLQGNILPGLDLYGQDPKGWTDAQGHGTGMAGIAVAHGHGSGDGALGIAPRAKVIPVRIGVEGDPAAQVLGREQATSPEQFAQALTWLVNNGVKIISISYSVDGGDVVQNAIKAARARGVLLMASAGNTTAQTHTDNGAINMHFTVGASDKDGKLDPITVAPGPFDPIDLLAPGRDIPTTSPGGKYRSATGTSNSSPIIAGLAALIWAEHPELTADDVAWRIASTARDVGAPGVDRQTGHGLIDPVAALQPNISRSPASPKPSYAATCRYPWQSPPACDQPPPGKPIAGNPVAEDGGQTAGWIITVVLAWLVALIAGAVAFLLWRHHRRDSDPAEPAPPDAESAPPAQP